jgi:hypothetical protein
MFQMDIRFCSLKFLRQLQWCPLHQEVITFPLNIDVIKEIYAI